MAIIEELGLEVKVIVDDTMAPEYPDEEPNDGDVVRSATTVACHRYVESVDDAEFSMYFGLIPGTNTGQDWIGRSSKHGLAFSVSFDGGPYVETVGVHQQGISMHLDGIHNKENQTLRKFRFAPVSTVDDTNKDRINKDMKVAQNLGLIRVCVRRGVLETGAQHQTRSPHGAKIEKDSLSLAEKALKGRAISHATALSAPVQSTKRTTCRMDCVDGRDSPLAIFYFKYRSKEALQTELIITRPRSLSVDSDLGNLSPDEIHRLALERLSQIKNGKKRALSVKDEDDARVAKPERPFRYARIEGGKKAIDLTEDD